MTGFTLTTALAQPYGPAVEAVRAALGEQGFGILSEIDLRATLQAKLGVEVAAQVILGACRPALAYEPGVSSTGCGCSRRDATARTS